MSVKRNGFGLVVTFKPWLVKRLLTGLAVGLALVAGLGIGRTQRHEIQVKGNAATDFTAGCTYWTEGEELLARCK